MSEFDGVESATPSAERLPKFTPGEYLLEVTANKTFKPKKGTSKVILREFKILESVGPEALPAGTEAAAKLLYFSDTWFHARLAEYVRGLTNAKTVDSSMCEAIFGEENPAKGKKIKLRVYSDTSEGGKAYLKYDFRYVADDDVPETKKAKK